MCTQENNLWNNCAAKRLACIRKFLDRTADRAALTESGHISACPGSIYFGQTTLLLACYNSMDTIISQTLQMFSPMSSTVSHPLLLFEYINHPLFAGFHSRFRSFAQMYYLPFCWHSRMRSVTVNASTQSRVPVFVFSSCVSTSESA